MTEREESIEWQVCLKEAGAIVRAHAVPRREWSPQDAAADIKGIADDLWAWRQDMGKARDPSPQETSYDEPPPHPGPSSGPPAPHYCAGCRQEMEYFSGTKNDKDYAGYRCPNQKKTDDPAEQAAEKVRHPVQWID